MHPQIKSLVRLLALAITTAAHAQPATQPDAHDDHGPLVDLGTQRIGEHDVQVSVAGAVKAGEEAVLIVKPTGKDAPKAVRAWVGVESGQGSIKTRGEEEKPGEWHAHHKVSRPMPAGGKVWVEVETAAGRRRASFDLKG